MKFKIHWLYAAAVAVIVFIGFALFPMPDFTPELNAEVAVVEGLRPAAGMFPGFWRYLAALLPPSATAYGFVGWTLAAVFGAILFFALRRALLVLSRSAGGKKLWQSTLSPVVAGVVALMTVFAEPVWRAFSLFTPTSLTMIFVAASFLLYMNWIVFGGWLRLCGGLALVGFFTAETPLALLFPVGFTIVYKLLWMSVRDGKFVPRKDLPPLRYLPVWRMFLSFTAGLLVGGGANLLYAVNHDISGALGWELSYLLFHYWQQYLAQITTAATWAGWTLGIVLCVMPFIVSAHLYPRLSDDDRQMPFFLGLVALVIGLIAYFEQGPVRGAWFWAWFGDTDTVSSATLLAFFSLLASAAVAFSAGTFVSDAFDPKRSEGREHGVNQTYRISVAVIALALAALVLPRLPHARVRRLLEFNASAVAETVRELNGAKRVFTDGSADAALELEARRRGDTLYAVNLMGLGDACDLRLRLRGITDEGDIEAAKLGAPVLLRVWACDKNGGLDETALQLGFDLWKREQSLKPPAASAFVARTRGLRDADVEGAAEIAAKFADRIVELTPDANAPEIPSAVRREFFTISWRLSRFARYRRDSQLAEKLDAMNSALKRMLRDLEYERLRVFMQMTPREGLEFALRRADFNAAARYAASVLKLDTDDPRGNFAMGMYYLAANRLADAEGYLRKVLVKRPEEPAVINNLSIICRKTGRIKEALELAKEAKRLLPENADVATTLADAEAAVAEAEKKAEKKANKEEKSK